MKFFILVLIILTAIVTADSRQPRMVGGRDAGVTQFPYQVALEVGGQFYCGGSIIHPRFVLTAAHCFFDENDSFKSYSVNVIAGATDLNSAQPTKVKVRAETLFTPKALTWMSGYIEGDIAVLRLSQPLNTDNNSYIKKIDAPEVKSYWGEKAMVTGYGKNWVSVVWDNRTGSWKRGQGGTTGKLRYSEAYITPNAECATENSQKYLPDSIVCAKTVQLDPKKPTGICGGDSGGPLVVKGKVVGIASVSPLECKENFQSAIYTRVSHWREFIEDVIANRHMPNMYITTLAS